MIDPPIKELSFFMLHNRPIYELLQLKKYAEEYLRWYRAAAGRHILERYMKSNLDDVLKELKSRGEK